MKKILFILILLPVILQAQIISTIAGNGTYGYNGDGIPATNAWFIWPKGVAIDRSGTVYITDQDDRIRIINRLGIIQAFAGNGINGYNGDGILATAAEINGPGQVIIDGSGNAYIPDAGNYRIRKVNTSGIISTFAGNGSNGFSGNGGLATTAELCEPAAVAFDDFGNIYIAEGNRIRKVDSLGIISTFAGNTMDCSTTGGFNGDGGPATAAELFGPSSLAIGYSADHTKAVFIADYFNKRIRIVNSAGIINTFAGGGNGGLGNGGPATACELLGPTGVVVDNIGNVYIVDEPNSSVRVVNQSGIINTFAGNYSAGFSGDGGPATAAQLNHPLGIAVDDSGNVYIDDLTNNRIRKVSKGTTSVNSLLLPENEINVYPNPAKNDFSVSAPFQINSIVVSDLLGQVIFKKECNSNKVPINVTELPAGIYFIKVNSIYTRKFVKS